MTTAQLKEILKSNVLIMQETDGKDPAQMADHIDRGAHILLAPEFRLLNSEDEAILDEFFEAASDKAFVAGQIRSTAEDLTDDEVYQDYYGWVLRQATWLDEQDVSMIFLTDCCDTVAAKCAIYAIREVSALPICVGVRLGCDENAIKKAISLLITTQSLDVCAVGCTNMPIDDALDILTEMQAFTTVPLFSLCNPGQFLEPEGYGDYIPSFVHQKCAIVGLSDGSPSFSAVASKELWQLCPLHPDFPILNAICSQDEVMFLDFSGNIISKNKQLLEIKTESGAELEEALALFNQPGARPVCFDIKDIDLLEYAIMHYAGRPAVKSDEYGEITAKEFGALVIKPE